MLEQQWSSSGAAVEASPRHTTEQRSRARLPRPSPVAPCRFPKRGSAPAPARLSQPRGERRPGAGRPHAPAGGAPWAAVGSGPAPARYPIRGQPHPAHPAAQAQAPARPLPAGRGSLRPRLPPPWAGTAPGLGRRAPAVPGLRTARRRRPPAHRLIPARRGPAGPPAAARPAPARSHPLPPSPSSRRPSSGRDPLRVSTAGSGPRSRHAPRGPVPPGRSGAGPAPRHRPPHNQLSGAGPPPLGLQLPGAPAIRFRAAARGRRRLFLPVPRMRNLPLAPRSPAARGCAWARGTACRHGNGWRQWARAACGGAAALAVPAPRRYRPGGPGLRPLCRLSAVRSPEASGWGLAAGRPLLGVPGVAGRPGRPCGGGAGPPRVSFALPSGTPAAVAGRGEARPIVAPGPKAWPGPQGRAAPERGRVYRLREGPGAAVPLSAKPGLG